MYFIGNLDDRVKRAKRRARDVYFGTGGNLDNEILRLRFAIAIHYSIPIFHEYFEERTIDDLVFEAELIYLYKKPNSDKTADVVKEMRQESAEGKKTELDSLFDDMIDKPPEPPKQSEWVDMGQPVTAEDMNLDKLEEQFFSSGEFKGEDK